MYTGLEQRAKRIMGLLSEMPEVKGCKLYGSMAGGEQDALSDIDIEIDVSGCDNGRFMLGLVERLKEQTEVYYSDYAPSLVPERYIVSAAVDEENPFCMVDLCCVAEPHCATVSKQQVRELNDEFSHVLKLWTANLKHFARGINCRDDIVRMAKRIGLDATHESGEILSETLDWLEKRCDCRLQKFMKSCRGKFDELVR